MDQVKDEASITSSSSEIYPSANCHIQKIADKFETENLFIKVLLLPVANLKLSLYFNYTVAEELNQEQSGHDTLKLLYKYNSHARKGNRKYWELSIASDS